MAIQRTAKKGSEEEPRRGIEGVPLEPIRVVERELTRPDGTKLRVKVPVYPPFELAQNKQKSDRPDNHREQALEKRLDGFGSGRRTI